jgi:hypothetical protein
MLLGKKRTRARQLRRNTRKLKVDDPNIPVRPNQNILRSNVAMQYTKTVNSIECLYNLLFNFCS